MRNEMKEDGILNILHIAGLIIPLSIGIDELCSLDSRRIQPSAWRSAWGMWCV